MPRIAALLELIDDMISNRIAFSLGEPALKTAHDFARAAEGKGHCVLESVPSGPGRLWLHKMANLCS